MSLPTGSSPTQNAQRVQPHQHVPATHAGHKARRKQGRTQTPRAQGNACSLIVKTVGHGLQCVGCSSMQAYDPNDRDTRTPAISTPCQTRHMLVTPHKKVEQGAAAGAPCRPQHRRRPAAQKSPRPCKHRARAVCGSSACANTVHGKDHTRAGHHPNTKNSRLACCITGGSTAASRASAHAKQQLESSCVCRKQAKTQVPGRTMGAQTQANTRSGCGPCLAGEALQRVPKGGDLDADKHQGCV